MARRRRRGAQPKWHASDSGLLAAVVALLSLVLHNLDKIALAVDQLSDVWKAMPWRAHVYCASAVELAPSLVLAALSVRHFPPSPARTQWVRALLLNSFYYTALLFSEQVGRLSLGQNTLLELNNLAFGFTLANLSSAIAPQPRKRAARALDFVTAAVALSLAAALFLSSDGQRAAVAAYGVSYFLALCAFRLWWVTRSPIANVSLCIYWLALLLRPLLILRPELMATCFGVSYYVVMTAKFGYWDAFRADQRRKDPSKRRAPRLSSRRAKRWWSNAEHGASATPPRSS
jgi:hypothetical protein